MKRPSPAKPAIRAWTPARLAVFAIAGCTTPPAGLIAGGPSSHVAQNYETLTSTAASASVLTGATYSRTHLYATETASGVTAVTGSLTHNTGRLDLSDGTFLFVDANGADASGLIADTGSGSDYGSIGKNFSGSYQYVFPFQLTIYNGLEVTHSDGVAGIATTANDMPSGGAATYTGESHLEQQDANAGFFLYEQGTSTVAVDFASSTADITLGSFANVGSTIIVTPATAPLDEIRGTGIAVSGVTFSGGSWVTVKGGVVVNITGAHTTASSSGTFFGYDPSISAPDEVGGVILINGDTSRIQGVFIAD